MHFKTFKSFKKVVREISLIFKSKNGGQHCVIAFLEFVQVHLQVLRSKRGTVRKVTQQGLIYKYPKLPKNHILGWIKF